MVVCHRAPLTVGWPSENASHDYAGRHSRREPDESRRPARGDRCRASSRGYDRRIRLGRHDDRRHPAKAEPPTFIWRRGGGSSLCRRRFSAAPGECQGDERGWCSRRQPSSGRNRGSWESRSWWSRRCGGWATAWCSVPSSRCLPLLMNRCAYVISESCGRPACACDASCSAPMLITSSCRPARIGSIWHSTWRTYGRRSSRRCRFTTHGCSRATHCTGLPAPRRAASGSKHCCRHGARPTIQG